MPKIKKNGEIIKKQDDALKALVQLEYVFEGATTPFVVLKETARRMKKAEDLIGLPCLEFGVIKRQLSEYAIRTFQTMLGDNWQEGKINDVPYKIQIIKGNWKIFEYPDSIMYWGGFFKTGNPWEKYWRARFLIK